MSNDKNRVHHVVGLVKRDNFHSTIARLSTTLQTAFYGPVERPDFGMQFAISLDAGIELLAPLSDEPDDPLNRDIQARGERWITVVIGVPDFERACERLARLGYQMTRMHSVLDGPAIMPFADQYSRFDEASFPPEAFGGLSINFACTEKRIV